MTTLEDAAPPADLTLARTGTIKGAPAMIAFDGSKRTVLLVQKGDAWTQEREVQYGGIRGMGLLAKYLDEDSARRADQTPIFEEGKAAPEAKAPKASPATLATVAATATEAPPVTRTRKAKAPVAPKVEAPAAPPAPVGPVPDAAIVAHLGMERAVQVAAMTDLGALRTLRESVIKAGAPVEVVRAITLRAGEIACGFTLAGVKKAPVAKVATEKSPRAPSTSGTGKSKATPESWTAFAEAISSKMPDGKDAVLKVPRADLKAQVGEFSDAWNPMRHGAPGGRALEALRLQAKMTAADGFVITRL